MATKTNDPVAEAIRSTEQELFAGAFDKEEHVEDDSGDRSREDMTDEFDEADEAEAVDAKPESDKDKGEVKDGEEDAEADEEGQKRDGKGKFVKADKAEDDEADGDKDAKSETDDDGKVDKTEPLKSEAEGRVPPGRLREQTERAKTAEAERDAARAEAAAVREEIKATNARLDSFLTAIQRQQPPKAQEQPKTDTRPDIFENPEGFVEHLTKGFQSELTRRDQQMEALRVDMSMQAASGRHADTFNKAYEAVSKLDPRNPDDQVTVRRIWASPNPGEALVRWHRNAETLREVGDDPAKFKERIANETRESLMKDPEFRKQLLAGLREEASGANADGKPRTVTRLPKSLNGASGGRRDADDSSPIDDTDGAHFKHAFQIQDA